jgi:histidinol-phosphate aminotransferase
VYPSDANFLLVEVSDANQVYDYLLTKGIVVRNRTTQPGCHNCLRISVGTAQENQALVAALQDYSL